METQENRHCQVHAINALQMQQEKGTCRKDLQCVNVVSLATKGFELGKVLKALLGSANKGPTHPVLAPRWAHNGLTHPLVGLTYPSVGSSENQLSTGYPSDVGHKSTHSTTRNIALSQRRVSLSIAKPGHLHMREGHNSHVSKLGELARKEHAATKRECMQARTKSYQHFRTLRQHSMSMDSASLRSTLASSQSSTNHATTAKPIGGPPTHGHISKPPRRDRHTQNTTKDNRTRPTNGPYIETQEHRYCQIHAINAALGHRAIHPQAVLQLAEHTHNHITTVTGRPRGILNIHYNTQPNPGNFSTDLVNYYLSTTQLGYLTKLTAQHYTAQHPTTTPEQYTNGIQAGSSKEQVLNCTQGHTAIILHYTTSSGYGHATCLKQHNQAWYHINSENREATHLNTPQAWAAVQGNMYILTPNKPQL